MQRHGGLDEALEMRILNEEFEVDGIGRAQIEDSKGKDGHDVRRRQLVGVANDIPVESGSETRR